MATNIYTTQFATKAELSSEINQTTREINLSVDEKLKTYPTEQEMKSAINISAKNITTQVSKKVGKEEIIAQINEAVKDKQGIITLTGNQVTIDSDYFTLDKTGNIVAKSGTIAGLTMSQNSNKNSYLFKNYTDSSGNGYQSGLYIPNENGSLYPFLYAGCPANGYLTDSNLYIRHDGYLKAKWFDVNGESGYFNINYDSGNTALNIDKTFMSWKIDDENNNDFFQIVRNPNYMEFRLYDSRDLTISDGVHGSQMVVFKKYDPDRNTGHFTQFLTDVYVQGTKGNGIDNSIYVQGYEVATNPSDERLKNNILDSEIKALELINKIHHKSFDWDKEKAHKEGHIDCGYIAQELIKIDSNFVIYNKEHDTYQINTLYVLATSTKAIQELNAKIEKQDKIIEFLAEKLGCKNEVLEMLKEGE